MERSETATWTTSQPLLMKAGSDDEMRQSSEEESKSTRCLGINYYIRYTVCTVAILCCLLYNQRNSIESAVANVRATYASRYDHFKLHSSSFKDGDSIPSKYNSTFSPQLQWNNPPPFTQSFVLIVEDLDTTYLSKHWMIYNIPSNITELSEGIQVLPLGAVILRNDISIRFQYDGPSLSRDDFRKRQHRYAFRLFALKTLKLELPSGSGRLAITTDEDLYLAMEPFILKEATLIGTYDSLHHD